VTVPTFEGFKKNNTKSTVSIAPRRTANKIKNFLLILSNNKLLIPNIHRYINGAVKAVAIKRNISAGRGLLNITLVRKEIYEVQ